MSNYLDTSIFISVSSGLILLVKIRLRSPWLESRALICPVHVLPAFLATQVISVLLVLVCYLTCEVVRNSNTNLSFKLLSLE